MTLTKDQRHTAYLIMEAEIESGELCPDYIGCMTLFGLTSLYFPELRSHFEKYRSTWEDGRLRILRQCIKETVTY